MKTVTELKILEQMKHSKAPLNKIYFDKYDRFDFELTDDTGEHHSIPLHRIRLVYRNGELI